MDEFQNLVLDQLKALSNQVGTLTSAVSEVKSDVNGLKNDMAEAKNTLERVESRQDAMHERLIQNTRDIKNLKAYSERGFDTMINMFEALDSSKADKVAL